MDPSLQVLLRRLDQLTEEFRELRDGVQKAILVAKVDSEMALTRARKVLEYVVRDVYQRRIQEPPGTRPLENLLQRLVKDGFMPDRVDAYANTIRKLGNVGTHKFGEKVTVADVQQSLSQLTQILEWYFEQERPEALARRSAPRPPSAPAMVQKVPVTAKEKAAPSDRQPAAGRSKHRPSVVVAGLVGVLLFGLLIGLWAGGVVGGKRDDTGRMAPREPMEPLDAAKQPVAPPADAALVNKVKNASGIELVSIPNGWFYMGSEDGDSDERPRHKVTISQPFYLGKTKVTRAQFQRFVDDKGYQTEAEKAGDKTTWKNPGFEQTGEHPVVCVSWNDAVAFCDRLKDKTGAKVRLPYEAEWEYSCRARTTTNYYFGDDEAKLGDYAWYHKNTSFGTKPCGQKLPNDFKLYDMHGLAWELCADGKRTYEKEDVTDPKGPLSAGAFRVYRGGSWWYDTRLCRAALRADNAPSWRWVNIGFRVLVSR
jgi:formylglycine-generating enzyme required for sulfatase activity